MQTQLAATGFYLSANAVITASDGNTKHSTVVIDSNESSNPITRDLAQQLRLQSQHGTIPWGDADAPNPFCRFMICISDLEIPIEATIVDSVLQHPISLGFD